MPGPQPVEATKVSEPPPAGGQAAALLRKASGEIGDQLFKFAMFLCGLAVLAMLGLIVYELALRSGHLADDQIDATRLRVVGTIGPVGL